MTDKQQTRIRAIKKALRHEGISLHEILQDLQGVNHRNLESSIQKIDDAISDLDKAIDNHNEFKKNFKSSK